MGHPSLVKQNLPQKYFEKHAESSCGKLIYILLSCMSNTTAPAAVLSTTQVNKMSLNEAKLTLIGREVEYYPHGKSNVNDVSRAFRIVAIDRVCDSNKTGLRYVTAHVIDRDMDNTQAIKALNLCSIAIL